MNWYANKLQPVYFAAAVSVIILSAVGIAAITGHLPGAASTPADAAPAAAAPAATAPGPAQPKAIPAQKKTVQANCADCGVIEDIRGVQVAGETSGLGAAAGGVTGAIIGNQFGRGNGRTLAAIAGAAGGAFAGNAIEKNMHKRVIYRVTLRMDDGSRRSVTQPTSPAFAVGEHVRVVGQRIVERV